MSNRNKEQRVLFEDALKHIYDYRYRDIPADIKSLAGALQCSSKKVLDLIKKMEQRNLISVGSDGFHLTSKGKAWALQVIRAHRLWESYLSDEIGLPLDQIHTKAEKKEHELTASQADALEAQLGYPERDPHGDPIPSGDQQIEARKGVCLLDWPKGDLARIVHIEDEPENVFTQILAEGLILDTCLKITESGEKGLHIWTLLNEFWIAPIVAANIFVEEAPAWFAERNVETASTLKPGEEGKILALISQGLTRRRFMDLGLVPGTLIKCSLKSAMKDPVAYEIRDTLIALRKEQSDQILIQRTNGKNKTR